MRNLLLVLLTLLAGNLPAAAVQPVELWHGKVLQVDVRHPGADWVPRDVIGLRYAYAEQGDVRTGFVRVELVDSETRTVSLSCEGKTVASISMSPTSSARVEAECFGVRYRLASVEAAAAKYPRVATPPFPAR